MKLSDLAFGCYLYGAFNNYDKSYKAFLKTTDYSTDLTISNHRKELLIWLNSWGCRQFAIEYHEIASQEILSWYYNYKAVLPGLGRNLWELTKDDFASLGPAYESLLKCTASLKKLKGGTSHISIGPTGASKILFAVRPKALIPWDESIRQHYGYENDKKSYLSYLLKVKQILEKLRKQCAKNGFQLEDLPRIFKRPHSSIPKLIDEYHWVTISNNCSTPNSETLLLWAKWDQN